MHYPRALSAALVTRTTLTKMLGVSYPTSALIVAQEGFPEPVKLGRRLYWKRDAVLAWIAAL